MSHDIVAFADDLGNVHGWELAAVLLFERCEVRGLHFLAQALPGRLPYRQARDRPHNTL